MNLLLKKIYIFIFTNLQIVLTLVNILLLIIMVYLIYKTLIETKKPDIEKVKIIDVKELSEGKSFSFKMTHIAQIYKYYLSLKNKKYEDTDIIFSYLTQNENPKKITQIYFKIYLLKRFMLFACFYQILLLNSSFEKSLNLNFQECISFCILYLTYLTIKYKNTCLDVLTEKLKNEDELKTFIKYQQSLLNDSQYQFSKIKWSRKIQTLCEPYLKENTNGEFMKIELKPPVNFTRFLILIMFLLFFHRFFHNLLLISIDDIFLQNMSLINTNPHSIYLSRAQELHYEYTLGVFHGKREIMQQYFFIEKSGFLESIDGVNIKKNYLTCPNGYLKEMNVREIFEFLKTK